MGKFFLFVILIFGTAQGVLLSQQMYAVRGTVYVRDGKANKVNLSVCTPGKDKRVPVDIDGNFLTRLDWNNNYQFCFTKPGYVSKRINFSTKIPEHINKDMIYPYQILVELFPVFPNADTTFFRNPVAKIKYSNSNNDFDYDLDYQLIVKDKINKIKNQYTAWRKSGVTKVRPTQKVVSEKQAVTAIRYQKSVETGQKNNAIDTKSTVKRIPKTPLTKNENPFNLPPLKKDYPNGKSIEIYDLKGKVITRVIIKKDAYQKVFYQVKHNWGGLYYFVEESPTYYRSISKYNYEKATQI